LAGRSSAEHLPNCVQKVTVYKRDQKRTCVVLATLPKTSDNAKIRAKSGENILRGCEVAVRIVKATQSSGNLRLEPLLIVRVILAW
jgi:hypothetical protein